MIRRTMKTLTTIAAMAVCLSLYADTFEISYDVRNDNEVVFNYAKSYHYDVGCALSLTAKGTAYAEHGKLGYGG